MAGFPAPELASERLILRQVGERDAGEVHAVWQDERFVQWAPVGYAHAHGDLAAAVEWCTAGAETRRADPGKVEFALEPRGAGRMAGLVGLTGADWDNRVAEIHYWTAAWARGRGYAAEGTRVLAEWALRDAGLERIALVAAAGNAASRHVAVAAGFRLEGVLRSAAALRDGGRTDYAVYGLVRADLARPGR
ncbi:GNAT family N-acetyltransferase [Actinoplanes sp. RD1]|uniref:GNAT family N-acetyltransferase n=1 Tax=Actinoplanes sp. RD1 TaxID=3064538 RepID=UPI0027412A6D|nr:GNAT family N-acetyltransferase [Actinoplanes sp. RD1]